MRTTIADRPVRDRLHRRRWAIMSRYPVWDDDWLHKLSDEDARALLTIFEALLRVERGTYGVCVNCGATIDVERLSALPESPVCMVCATFARDRHASAVH